MKYFYSLFLAGGLLWTFTPTSESHSGYLDQVRYNYQKTYRCTLCHAPSALNQLGQDLAKLNPQAHTLQQAMKTWAQLDSDGDGFSNEIELKAGCHPGLANENPAFKNCTNKSLQKSPQKH